MSVSKQKSQGKTNARKVCLDDTGPAPNYYARANGRLK